MDTKRPLDLVTGRLAKVPTRHGTTGPRPKKASSYGASRLGITPDREPKDPEAVEAAPAAPPPAPAPVPSPAAIEAAPPPAAPPARTEPAKPKLARPNPPARRADPAPAAVTVVGLMGRLRSLNAEHLRAWVRRPRLIAAAIGAVAAVAVALFAFSGGPETPLVPQTPASVRAAAPALPAPPAKPLPPKPDPVAITKPAPPADPATARRVQGLLDKMASLPSTWLKQVREAQPRVQPNPSVPSPPAQPRETPKPEQAAPATPPTYDYVPCPPGFRFTGAIQSSGASFANINGRFVPVGGTVAEARVVEINASSAVLEREGKRFVVGFDTETAAPTTQDEDVQDKNPPATTQPAAGAGNQGD